MVKWDVDQVLYEVKTSEKNFFTSSWLMTLIGRTFIVIDLSFLMIVKKI
jgi:hypothetical protein